MTEKYFWVGEEPDYDDIEALQAEAFTQVAGTRRLFERPLTEEHRMKLDLGIMAGAESKQFLVDFTKQLDRLEKLTGGRGLAALTGKKTAAASDDTEEEEETEVEASETETDDEDFAPKKKSASKKAASFDDEEEESTEAAEEEEEEEAPAAKKTKAKKLTSDDVNDACKERARATGGKKGIQEVRAILLKKFKTQSVSDLKPEQYEAAIKAMAV